MLVFGSGWACEDCGKAPPFGTAFSDDTPPEGTLFGLRESSSSCARIIRDLTVIRHLTAFIDSMIYTTNLRNFHIVHT